MKIEEGRALYTWHVVSFIACSSIGLFVGLAYYKARIIVFRFIIENRSLRDFGP
jgi:hypothetical protein